MFDGRLEKYGITEMIVEGKSDAGARCLTDGKNYILAYGDPGGRLRDLSRSSQNDANEILWAIAQAFDTEIYDEEEPQYLGFDTHEEMYEWFLKRKETGASRR